MSSAIIKGTVSTKITHPNDLIIIFYRRRIDKMVLTVGKTELVFSKLYMKNIDGFIVEREGTKYLDTPATPLIIPILDD